MARALRAIGDTTKQNVLALPSLPGARMRACLGSLWPIPAPRLRGHGASGSADGMLVANATCLPSGLFPSFFFLLLVTIACGASLPRPPGMRILDTIPRRPVQTRAATPRPHC